MAAAAASHADGRAAAGALLWRYPSHASAQLQRAERTERPATEDCVSPARRTRTTRVRPGITGASRPCKTACHVVQVGRRLQSEKDQANGASQRSKPTCGTLCEVCQGASRPHGRAPPRPSLSVCHFARIEHRDGYRAARTASRGQPGWSRARPCGMQAARTCCQQSQTRSTSWGCASRPRLAPPAPTSSVRGTPHRALAAPWPRCCASPAPAVHVMAPRTKQRHALSRKTRCALREQ